MNTKLSLLNTINDICKILDLPNINYTNDLMFKLLDFIQVNNIPLNINISFYCNYMKNQLSIQDELKAQILYALMSYYCELNTKNTSTLDVFKFQLKNIFEEVSNET